MENEIWVKIPNFPDYEISNYAKKGYESIHNKIYWLNESYYGFGLGAVSYINNYRISNTKNLSNAWNIVKFNSSSSTVVAGSWCWSGVLS